jgi:hypothetical protein
MTTEEILEELSCERSKFTKSNEDKMRELVNLLIERGVYPAKSGIGYDAFKMMNSWGVDWYIYRGIQNCPACDTDLCDRENGPPFKREIGIYDRNKDRTVSWKCPDCGGEWFNSG